jgi:hypothetical protein
MRSISFITIAVAAGALTLPAAAQAESAAVFQAHGKSHAAKPVPRQVVAATVQSVSRRAVTVTMADGRNLRIPARSLVRGRHGRRLLATLQPGDRVVAVIRRRRNGGVRVRLVPLPADRQEDPGYDPGAYEGGEYEGGEYEGGDYDGGDYDPGDHDSESRANGGPRD